MLSPQLQDLLDALRQSAGDVARHGNYQDIPPGLPEEFYGCVPKYPKSRLDAERYEWMKSHAHFKNKRILEIGGNFGYFSIRALHEGAAAHSIIYEPDKYLAAVCRALATAFGVSNRVDVRTEPVKLTSLNDLPHADLLINLNVLHHAGYDFASDEVKSAEAWWNYARRFLNELTVIAPTMIFQTGFTWGGGQGRLCRNGENISTWTTRLVTDAGWKVEASSVAKRTGNGWEYVPASVANTQRNTFPRPRRLSYLRKMMPRAFVGPVRSARRKLFPTRILERDIKLFGMRPILICKR